MTTWRTADLSLFLARATWQTADGEAKDVAIKCFDFQYNQEIRNEFDNEQRKLARYRY
jgi:hypothetical protein